MPYNKVSTTGGEALLELYLKVFHEEWIMPWAKLLSLNILCKALKVVLVVHSMVVVQK